MKQELSVSNNALPYMILLRQIGVPGRVKKIEPADTLGGAHITTEDLLRLAEQNKIALLYLSELNRELGKNEKDGLSAYFAGLSERNQHLIHCLKEVASAFNQSKIKYCVFKTIKPFPTTPSDIDVLLSNDDFRKAESLLTSLGYRVSAQDAYSSTLHRGEMIVDLQIQPSVSNLPYLPAEITMQNSVIRNIEGVDVFTPNDEVEFLVIACHSILKEQLFTLNDYYSIVLLAERVNIERLMAVAQYTKTLNILELVTRLSVKITESAFGSDLRINKVVEALGRSRYSVPDIMDLPHRFSFMLVLRLLLSRALKDPQMRGRLLPAMIRMASPMQLWKLVAHFTRPTY